MITDEEIDFVLENYTLEFYFWRHYYTWESAGKLGKGPLCMKTPATASNNHIKEMIPFIEERYSYSVEVLLNFMYEVEYREKFGIVIEDEYTR